MNGTRKKMSNLLDYYQETSCSYTLREEIFAGINFLEFFFGYFAGINFRESAFSGVKKGIYFREFGQNSRNSRNFLPAKISSHKVYYISLVQHFKARNASALGFSCPATTLKCLIDVPSPFRWKFLTQIWSNIDEKMPEVTK